MSPKNSPTAKTAAAMQTIPSTDTHVPPLDPTPMSSKQPTSRHLTPLRPNMLSQCRTSNVRAPSQSDPSANKKLSPASSTRIVNKHSFTIHKYGKYRCDYERVIAFETSPPSHFVGQTG
jgi:hypothetical protein